MAFGPKVWGIGLNLSVKKVTQSKQQRKLLVIQGFPLIYPPNQLRSIYLYINNERSSNKMRRHCKKGHGAEVESRGERNEN